jgi:small subunit ribosomal protein S9
MAESDKYIYTIGRRKTSTATVRLFPRTGDRTVNDKKFNEIYKGDFYKIQLERPFVVAQVDPSKYSFSAKIVGGGKQSQLEALMLGISRALVKENAEVKPALKKESLLTRDSRKVERKKPGHRKARKSEQYSKR